MGRHVFSIGEGVDPRGQVHRAECGVDAVVPPDSSVGLKSGEDRCAGCAARLRTDGVRRA